MVEKVLQGAVCILFTIMSKGFFSLAAQILYPPKSTNILTKTKLDKASKNWCRVWGHAPGMQCQLWAFQPKYLRIHVHFHAVKLVLVMSASASLLLKQAYLIQCNKTHTHTHTPEKFWANHRTNKNLLKGTRQPTDTQMLPLLFPWSQPHQGHWYSTDVIMSDTWRF